MRSALAVLAVVAFLPIQPAEATEPGPPLSVPQSTLAGALRCPSAFTHPGHEAVLLVHGTAVTAEEHWGWNYAGVLPEQGFDVCTVALPDRALGDIQVAAEYVVYAVRAVAEASGGPIDVVGHSQGGLEPRWALRWWPDIPTLVDDFVGLSAPNHGTVVADAGCIFACAPAVWQMRQGSVFLTALNAPDETPGAVSYTSIWSQTDELVQPGSSSALDGAVNVAVQDICPGRPVHHVGVVHDPVVYALVVDALTSPGPADPSSVDPMLCLEATMPGVSVWDAAGGNLHVYGNGFEAFASHPTTPAEPPLAPYASGA